LLLNREISYKNVTGINKDLKSKLLDLKLINVKDSKPIIVEKTTCACFWCTEKFDSVPCFLPDKLISSKFYVFGCFCTPSCARKYNNDMDDYRTPVRDALIKRLYGPIFGEIPMAPEREFLQKFNGPLKLNEFRNQSLLMKKEFRMKLPPIIPLMPIIEEDPKNASNIIIPLKINQLKQKGKRGDSVVPAKVSDENK